MDQVVSGFSPCGSYFSAHLRMRDQSGDGNCEEVAAGAATESSRLLPEFGTSKLDALILVFE
jgi:hypothetical protein